MAGRVEGKVAIVTGGGTGIGRGIATVLAQHGAAVVIANRNAARGEEAAEAIRAAGGRAIFQRTDVTQEADCEQLVRRAVDEFGAVDVLVNNAGVFPRAYLEETTEELWDGIMDVNLKGPFFCCKYAVPEMRRRGKGSIINIGSPNAFIGLPELFAYSVSKGGLITLSRNLAQALAGDKIRVNFVNPGWVITEMEIEVQRSEGHDEAWLAEAAKKIPLGRHQEPEDSGHCVLYLASDESAMVTGQTINVDGGMTMR